MPIASSKVVPNPKIRLFGRRWREFAPFLGRTRHHYGKMARDMTRKRHA
jgi:hypothetical protein